MSDICKDVNMNICINMYIFTPWATWFALLSSQSRTAHLGNKSTGYFIFEGGVL